MCSHLKRPGPSGEWIEELTEKPQHVSVHVLSSTTALMSWTSSQENYNGTIVSVVSLTCQKQKESQRLEKQYCTQVKESPAVGLTHPWWAVQPPSRSCAHQEPGQECPWLLGHSHPLFPLRLAIFLSLSFFFHFGMSCSCRAYDLVRALDK